MKWLTSSRMVIALGIVVGMMVLMNAASARITPSADSLFGAWSPYSGCVCCDTTYSCDCNGGPWACNQGPLTCLQFGTFFGGKPDGGPVCSGPGRCNDVEDSCCNCCTP